MTQPADTPLYIYCGATFNGDVETWTWKIDDAAVNLTGYSARLKVRADFASATTARLSLTSAGGGLVLGGSAGTIAPAMTDAETAALWTDYGASLSQDGVRQGRPAYLLGFWDLELISGGGIVKRLLQGKCYLVPEATT